jgi:selenium metabolism protein YedF
MPAKTVDARGQLCPKPLILTKKALNERTADEPLAVLIDNATARQNVERFLTDNSIAFETEEREGAFTVRVTGSAQPLTHPDAESYCAPPAARPHVVCIKNDRMGFGDDALGEVLIKAFVNTIVEVEPLPSAIVFYNAGIHLALEGSAVLDALKQLEAKGVRILVCGTCADFYQVKESVRVGIISNMYDISETLVGAGHVVYP